MAIVSVDLDVCCCENDFLSAVCKENFRIHSKDGFNLDILTYPNICRIVRLLIIVDHVTRDFNWFHCRGIKKNGTNGKLSTFVIQSSVFLSIDIVDFVWNFHYSRVILGTRMTSAKECRHYNDK